MKAAKKFTRDSPCTKVDIFNAFRAAAGYPPRPVVEAKSVCGDNSVKYLVRENYLRAFTAGGVDFYQLTQDGIAWLERGIRRHIELHPEDATHLTYPIPGTTVNRTRRIVLTRPTAPAPAASPPSGKSSGTPLIRRRRV